ncbi:hypothetical protein ATR1_190c0001, partial [Acetobacter tropicalis]
IISGFIGSIGNWNSTCGLNPASVWFAKSLKSCRFRPFPTGSG